MNAGRDYARAKRQAQANANAGGEPWVVHGYGGVWWIAREASFTRAIPDGAEIIEPEAGAGDSPRAASRGSDGR